MMKRLLAIVLTIAMMLSMSVVVSADEVEVPAVDAWDGETDTDWYEAESTEFNLETAEQLAGLAVLVNNGNTLEKKIINLGADIDLEGKEWTPIGNSTYSFQGTFNGNDHTISNLVVTGNESNVGLFGFTTAGEIKNLTVENANVEGYLNVGVVAGTPYTSKYTNITVKGHIEVNGFSYVGGVGGKNAYASWTNVAVNADETSYVKADSVSGETAYRTYVGGVIGFMGEGGHTFTNVTSNIDVTGTVCDVGGITGIAHYGNNFVHCSSSGDVKIISDSTDESDLLEMGGLAGVWHNGGSDVTFKNCEFTGTVKAYYTNGTERETAFENDGVIGKAYSASGTGKLIIENDPIIETEEGKVYFETVTVAIEKAMEQAQTSEEPVVVKLTGDVVEENIVIKAPVSTLLFAANSTVIADTDVVLDLNGNTLTGNIIVESGASATIKNGKIVNEDSKASAIQSFGTTVLENLDVTSARHTVRVEGGITTINSGSYKIAAGKGNTLHAVNVSDGGSVVIYDGTFTGPKGTGRDSGSAVQIQANSTGTIYGGTFTGGLNSTLTAKGTLTVYDGLFDQDPKTYVAPGYASIKVNDMYGVAAKTTAGANEVIVEFAPTADENIYNINLVAGNDVINRLTSADLTFKLTSEKTDDNKDKVAYEILKYGNVNYKLEGTDRYLFNLNGVVTPDETGDVITIGQVKFGGYGKFSFEVVENAETNIVNATTISDNIVSSFVAEPETNEGQLTIDNSTLEDVEIKVPTKELTIKVEFNNAIKDKEAEYKNMKVLISGGDIINPQPVVLSEKDYVNGFKTTLTENIAYNVTVTGDGYRTARYTVTMTGDKTLTFWNNLKDAAEAIETDSDVKVKSNFLAGEIVADNDINIYDLSAVVSYFGKTGLTAADIDFIKYDLNRDGKINSVDVSFVLASWAD